MEHFLPFLHIARTTDFRVQHGLCQAMTGVDVNEGLLHRVELLRQARVAATAPDRAQSNLPIRYLIKHGFEGLDTTLPKKFDTTIDYLNAYCRRRHRDVLAYEKFVANGFGVMNQDAYRFASEEGLNRFGRSGSTREHRQVETILDLQGVMQSLPFGMIRRLSGLYWTH